MIIMPIELFLEYHFLPINNLGPLCFNFEKIVVNIMDHLQYFLWIILALFDTIWRKSLDYRRFNIPALHVSDPIIACNQKLVWTSRMSKSNEWGWFSTLFTLSSQLVGFEKLGYTRSPLFEPMFVSNHPNWHFFGKILN